MANPILTIKLYGGESIVVEMFSDRVPGSVDYFLSYVKTGYYDGLPFHTCVKDEYIQNGFYEKSGYGSPAFTYDEDDSQDQEGDYAKKDEFIPQEAGMLAFVEAKYPYLSKLQYAILFTDKPILSEGHEILFRPIGKIIEGYDYALSLSQVAVDDEFYPTKPLMVESVTADGQKNSIYY